MRRIGCIASHRTVKIAKWYRLECVRSREWLWDVSYTSFDVQRTIRMYRTCAAQLPCSNCAHEVIWRICRIHVLNYCIRTKRDLCRAVPLQKPFSPPFDPDLLNSVAVHNEWNNSRLFTTHSLSFASRSVFVDNRSRNSLARWTAAL